MEHSWEAMAKRNEPMPDGRRKYIRAKTQEELDAKVQELENLMSVGVDIGNNTTFCQLAQQWYDIYKKPNLRLRSQNSIKNVLNSHILPKLGGYLPRARMFLLLCLHTGARRGEALALRYEDIDFEHKIVHIRHNAIVEEGETVISDELKTRAGRRDVPLSGKRICGQKICNKFATAKLENAAVYRKSL